MILKNEKNQELNNKINDLIELVEKLDENNDINLSENTKKINEVIMQNLQINNEITQMHKTLKNQMNALNTSENEKKYIIKSTLRKQFVEFYINEKYFSTDQERKNRKRENKK